MISRSPQTNEADEKVIVSLAEVPLELRIKVAHELVKADGLTGMKALAVMLAAQQPRPTVLTVPVAKMELVVFEGKRPLGEMKSWKWW